MYLIRETVVNYVVDLLPSSDEGPRSRQVVSVLEPVVVPGCTCRSRGCRRSMTDSTGWESLPSCSSLAVWGTAGTCKHVAVDSETWFCGFLLIHAFQL